MPNGAAAQVLPCYGLADATLLATAQPWQAPPTNGPVPLGPAVAGTALRIAAHPAAPAGQGETHLAGPQVARAFWCPDQHQLRPLPLPQDDAGRAWFATGGLGCLGPGGLIAPEVDSIAAFGSGTPELANLAVELPRRDLNTQGPGLAAHLGQGI